MNAKTVRRLLRAINTPGIGLTPLQMHILAELAHRPGILMRDLGLRCHHHGRSIEKPVGALRRAGYIEKRVLGRPKAANTLHLSVTPLAEELLRALETAVTEPIKPKL